MREFVEAAFDRAGIRIAWEGSDTRETGRVAALRADSTAERAGRVSIGQTIVAVDPRYFRPTEVELLLGDPSRARDQLGWTPAVTFAELVTMMVDADLHEQEREQYLQAGGYRIHNYHE